MPRVIKLRGEQEEEVHSRWPILIILLAAAAIRIAGIGYGLPYSLNPEEERIVKQAFSLTNTTLKPVKFDGPVFMSYILAGEYGAWYGAGSVLGKFKETYEFEGAFRSDPSPFIILGRVTSILFALLSIYLVYVLAKDIFDWPIGLVAAAIVAVLPQHAYFSRLATGDMLAFLFTVAGMYSLLRLATQKVLASAFFASFLFGFAAAAEYEYIWLVVLAYVVYIAVVPRDYKVSAFILGVPMVAISFLFAFCLANGMLFLDPLEFLRGIETVVLGSSGILTLDVRETLPVLKTLVGKDIYDVSGMALGWGLVGAGALGILWGLMTAKHRRAVSFILLASVAVPAVLFYPIDGETRARWAMLIALPVALGAGFILRRIFWRRRIPAVISIILIVIFAAAICAQPAAQAGVMAERRATDDTRYQFALWGKETLPDSSTVIATPNAQYLLEGRVLKPGNIKWAMWRADILKHWNDRSYAVNLLPMPPGRALGRARREPLPRLDEADYVVTDSWTIADLKALNTPEAGKYLALLDAARAQGKVIKTFAEPTPGPQGFGPAIEVIELPKPVPAPAVAPPPAVAK